MIVALEPPVVARVEQRLAGADSTSVVDVVSRAIGASSWLLVIGADGRLSGISVLGAPPDVTALADLDLPIERGPARVPVVRDEDGRISLEPGSAVARRVGGTAATPQQLLDLALRDADPAVRSDAIRAAVRAIASDRELERTTLSLLDNVDDAALAKAVVSTAGGDAPELLAVVVAEAGQHPIGRRAQTLLERVR